MAVAHTHQIETNDPLSIFIKIDANGVFSIFVFPINRFVFIRFGGADVAINLVFDVKKLSRIEPNTRIVFDRLSHDIIRYRFSHHFARVPYRFYGAATFLR